MGDQAKLLYWPVIKIACLPIATRGPARSVDTPHHCHQYCKSTRDVTSYSHVDHLLAVAKYTIVLTRRPVVASNSCVDHPLVVLADHRRVVLATDQRAVASYRSRWQPAGGPWRSIGLWPPAGPWRGTGSLTTRRRALASYRFVDNPPPGHGELKSRWPPAAPPKPAR